MKPSKASYADAEAIIFSWNTRSLNIGSFKLERILNHPKFIQGEVQGFKA